MGEIIDKKWFAGLGGTLLIITAIFLSAQPAASVEQRVTSAQVTIPTYIDIALFQVPILFGTVEPGTLNRQADDGAANDYDGDGQVDGFPVGINVTENTNVNVNLTANMSTNYTYGTDYILPDNHTFENTSAFTCYQNLSADELINETPDGICNIYWPEWTNVQKPGPGANATLYMYNWLNIPIGQARGTYTGQVTIKAWPA
jgi:hypothetical protein